MHNSRVLSGVPHSTDPQARPSESPRAPVQNSRDLQLRGINCRVCKWWGTTAGFAGIVGSRNIVVFLLHASVCRVCK